MKYIKLPYFLLLFSFNLLLTINTVKSQNMYSLGSNICGDVKELRELLKKTHNEDRIWKGLANNNKTVLELFINENQGSWTLIETKTSGISCAIIGGKESFLDK